MDRKERTVRKEVEYLDPRRKLVDAVADWLLGRVRNDAAGAKSLAHVMVVVPTAQAGRRLRLALAQRVAEGLVPPLVKMPAHLLQPARAEIPEADAVTELAVLAEVLRAAPQDAYPVLFPRAPERRSFADAVDVAQGLLRVWRILGENGLLMREVAARAPELLKGDGLDLEIARWRDLAALEAVYLEALHGRGLRFRGESAGQAVADPPALSGVEEVVLPGLLSPIASLYKVLQARGLPTTVLIHADAADAGLFDEWGRVRPGQEDGGLADLGLQDGQIAVHATPAGEAGAVADWFAGVGPAEALPALTLVDDALFPEMQGAFQARSLRLHNPAREQVATSSLGHLLGQLVALSDEARYDVFSAFIRQGDVQRWLARALELPRRALVRTLGALDELKAAHLPERLDDVRTFATGDLRRVVDFVRDRLTRPGGLENVRGFLAEIFAARRLDAARPEDREFVAAATAVREMFDEFAGLALPEEQARVLFARRLQEATYSLEPDTGDVVQTDGWLEVPWVAEDELVIAGFQEGCVPESVVGHPFLPDALREGLGLLTNGMRAARDAFILREARACRRPEDVRISFHRLAADGTALKPSRLLLRTSDDQALARRARRFYAETNGTGETPARTLPVDWLLDLPVPAVKMPLEHISPSNLDWYLRCPFTYYLKRQFGESVDDVAEELDAAHFGTLCHDALDAWAKGPLADSEDAGEIAAELSRQVDRLLVAWFGLSTPAIVALQADSARRRLAAFAEHQVRRHREGWRIVATEETLQVAYDGTTVHGRCDRVDVNAHTGEWCVVDYKTWDKMDHATPWDTTKSAVEFARARGLPLVAVVDAKGRTKDAAWKSLQLPLYCAMLEVSGDVRFAPARNARRSACYCVLGKTAEETGFAPAMSSDAYQSEAENLIRRLLAEIRRGVFWPPAPSDAWQWEYAGLLYDRPELSVRSDWIADQEVRLARKEVPR